MANVTSEQSSPFSFVEAEHEMLSFWKEREIFQKSLQQTRDLPPYVFYDGPPFATGLPHHGHLVASTIKDVVPRYFTMKGHYIERRFGWDCHGLPIEHEIDKSLGMSAQETVAKIGIAGYNDACRGIVQRYTQEWEKTITRIGRWVDFDNDYRTMEPWYMETVWWVFKQIWEQGLVYQGEKVVAYSTELSTVLSNFEATSNYKDVQDPAITVLFKLEDENAYLSAWTTTPWTLPSNLALCVNGQAEYVKVLDETRNLALWVARERLDHVLKGQPYRELATCKGDDLVGKTYLPLFSYFSELAAEGAFCVVADDFVSGDSGTGIVHMAPAFGEDDHRIMKSKGITAMPCPLDERGRFTDQVPDLTGQYVKDADKSIIAMLRQQGQLYRHDTLVHSYPFCPRSDTPIIYRAVPSWYIGVEQIRDELVKNNQRIRWVPGHLRDGRMGKWLEGARDWAVSRNRYWGTPLPLWVNDVTGNILCIGSREELQTYSGVWLDDLHRDYVDNIRFSLPGEEGAYQRIDEVFDCWFESGSMPYAQVHYPFENQDSFGAGFPAEFIAEGVDQTRGWFYTLQVISHCLFKQPAFKNVIVNGIVMAEDGKKMSKRLKNYTAPDIIMDTYGADALRLYLLNSGLVKAEEQRFSDSGVQEMVRRMLLPWLNAFKFLNTYCAIDRWQYDASSAESQNPFDQWILARLQTLKQTVSEQMECYQLYNVVPPLFEFMESLTNWYIRLNRSRFWGEQMTPDKSSAYRTLFIVLDEFGKLMAPFAPFLAEYLYQSMQPLRQQADSSPESVHLCAYPDVDNALTNAALERSVNRLQGIILLGRQKRNQAGIKMKTPLPKLIVLHGDSQVLHDLARFDHYIRTELNVKDVIYSTDEADSVDFYAKPNFPVLGKRFGKSFKQYQALIEALDHKQLYRFQDEGCVTLAGEVFGEQDIQLFRKPKPGSNVVSNASISVDLDCQLTEALIGEGVVREVVGFIQKSRKQSAFKVSDRIEVRFQATPKLKSWLLEHRTFIEQETLALRFEESEAKEFEVETDNVEEHGWQFSIDEHYLSVSLKRVTDSRT